MNRHLNWSDRTTEQWAWDHCSRVANWHPAFSPLRFGRRTCAVLVSQVSLEGFRDSPTFYHSAASRWQRLVQILRSALCLEYGEGREWRQALWTSFSEKYREPRRNRKKKKIQNKNKKPNQTKTLSFSVFARVLKNTDNDAECLRENKNKPKMQTETNPKKQTLVCLTPETSGFVKQLGRQHKSMTLLSFIYLFLLLFQKTMA